MVVICVCVKHVMANSLSLWFCAASVVFLCSVPSLLERSHVQIEIYGIHIKRHVNMSLRLAWLFWHDVTIVHHVRRVCETIDHEPGSPSFKQSLWMHRNLPDVQF